MDVWDYVIVGAGSAGCVLADRLSANGQHSVLLLERGGSDRSIMIQMPTALSYPMNTDKYCWQFHSEPEPGLSGRQLHCPRGKVLGGSSSVNGMVYVRGHAWDYQEWVDQGADGWSYADCLPYFKRAESWEKGGDTYRGGTGPVGVCNGNQMRWTPLYRAFIEAGKQAGYPETQDYNGYQQEGFGPMHMTVKKGVRSSTANAYLRPALTRDNLTLWTDVLSRRLVLGQGEKGLRAEGVEITRNGQTKIVKARKEVILAAGSVGSPHLLQLSGIGPAKHLSEAGIKPIHDLPGVGDNLQDHLEVYFQYQCPEPITLNGKLNLWSKALIGTEWILRKTGLGATNHFESCAFIRSKAGVKAPDIQYHFLPAAMRYDGNAAFKGHGFQVHVGPNKPKSRGSIRVKNADPLTAPTIQFNYLTDQQDIEDWRHCIRLTREILQQDALAPYRQDEIQPGLNIESDAQIDQWVQENVESAYHPSCSCKMGAADDPTAVVTPDLKVRGVDQLRVVDSSVFPTIPNGNLNGPTIMVAEKASDHILGTGLLPSEDVPIWYAPDYQTSQR